MRRKISEIAWEVSLETGVVISTLIYSKQLKGQPIHKSDRDGWRRSMNGEITQAIQQRLEQARELSNKLMRCASMNSGGVL